MWLYGFGRFLMAVAYRTLYRIRVEGLENIPRDGGAIICANHFKGHDPIVMGVAANRPVAYMAKQELFRNPVFGYVLRSVGAFPVKRGQPDRAALKHALDLLASGTCFGIFPEGTRNRSGKLGKAEPGTAYLALKSGASVIPCGISGSYKLFSTVMVKFGPAVDLAPFRTGKLTSESMEIAGAKIMEAIGARLVPPVLDYVAAGRET